MLKTHISAENEAYRLFDDQSRYWQWVEHSGEILYHLTLGSPPDGRLASTRRFIFIADWRALEDAVSDQSASGWIDTVQTQTPPWLNGTNHWRLDPLERLDLVETEEGRVIVALTIGKRVIHDSPFDPESEIVRCTRVIYDAAAEAARGWGSDVAG